jgi:anthranilate 1,2-dioxygenase small subunit
VSPGHLELQQEVEGLLAEYADLIDDDRLEDWLDLFAEESSYRILSRENEEQSLPLALMLCDNKDMLRDRVLSLRKANIYNLHWDRHLVSFARIREEAGALAVTANYALFQTTRQGETRLFSVGRYRDRLVREHGRLRFRDKTVVVDTGAVLSLLATPI